MGGERKNKVDERTAVGIGALSGLICALSGAEPTSTGIIDTLILFVCGFLVAWAGASASWWVIGLAAVAAVATVGSATMVIVALMGFALAVYIGVKKQNLPELRALSAAFVVNALARSDLEVFLGFSAIVAIVVGLFVVFLGIQRRPSTVRATLEISGTIVGVAAIAAIVGFGVAAGTARAPLLDGNDLAKQGLSAVNQGDFEAAAEYFESATQAFTRAEDQLTKPWGQLARGVPIVSQHYQAATELSAAAAQATGTLVNAVRDVDVDSLTVTNGRVDLDTVAALEAPFTELSGALASLDEAVQNADSQWLVPLVSDELRDLEDDLVVNDQRLDNAIAAVNLAPQMLGGDEDRYYLVLFTTPAEARGLGGFPGNYAVLRASDGRLRMPKFGRVTDLNLAIDDDTRLVGPPGFLDRYGDYVLDPDSDADGAVAGYAWSNVTMSPHFPWVAAVAAELFPQTGGRPVDGVIVMDPFVLQTLLQYTGPIEVEGFDEPLTSENAANVLLKEQYLITDKDERVDFLEDAAEQTFAKLLQGSLPSPVVLARDLGPLAVQGRLLMWTTDAAERDLLRNTYMLGEFPTFDGGDGVGMAITNLGGNKIDTYLQRELNYESSVETSTGLRRADLALTLTNTSPASGLPAYVIGNRLDLPTGTNRLRLCVHTPLSLREGSTGDADDRGFEPGIENGLNVYCSRVTVPPQGAVTVTMELFGELDDLEADPQIWEQPLANPLVIAGEE